MSTTQQARYIVFARYPALGKVKTRLARKLGADKALAIYKAMMLDIIERLQKRAAVSVYVYPPADLAKFRDFVRAELRGFKGGGELEFRPQSGANLGDQMLNAFREQAEQNHLPAIIIGTDSPSLPDEFLQMAEAELGKKQAVIGACEDGGFYLLGLHQAQAAVFFGADYSHDKVYRKTLAALENCCAQIAESPLWYDIDYVEDLQRLHAELLQGDRGGYTPPRTFSLLERLFETSHSDGAIDGEREPERH